MTQTNELASTPANGQGMAPAPERVIARQIVEDNGPLAFIMDTARFEHLKQIASVMALMSVLPDHLRTIGRDKAELPMEKVKANCFRIVNQACRWGIDPFAMVDETFVVGGKLGYSGKLVAAVVNTRAGLSERLSYEHSGSGDSRTVKVIGKFKGEDKARDIELKVADARTDNQMWKKDPDQKLVYSGVVKWARRYCPEIVLGVVTEDDIDRMAETTRVSDEPTQLENALATARAAKNAGQSAESQPTSTETKSPDPETTAKKSETPDNGPDRQASMIPAHSRTSSSWIDDLITSHKPQHLTAHAAREFFHGLHKPKSWETLDHDVQDAYHADLVGGEIAWPEKKGE